MGCKKNHRKPKMMGGKMKKEKIGYMKGGAVKDAMPKCKPN
jgi:hypothetical protein